MKKDEVGSEEGDMSELNLEKKQSSFLSEMKKGLEKKKSSMTPEEK